MWPAIAPAPKPATRRYGQTGQVRVLIEGINTTEGTGGAGFYFDYASLEEAFLGTTGQSAEMPNPGVQSQFIARSGSNRFQGEYHLDWYNNAMQASNIPDEYTVPTAFNNSPSARTATKWIATTTTTSTSAGRSSKDRAWMFVTYREQFSAVAQPNFLFDQTFDTKLWNPVVKATYQTQPEEQADWLLPVGAEGAAEPPAVCDLHLCVAGTDLQAGLGQLGLQGRMERHGQRQAVSRGALWRLRVLLSALHQQPRQFLLARHRPPRLGGRAPEAAARSRSPAVHRRRDLLRRFRSGQPHVQDGRGVAAREIVGRLRVATRRHQQHRADLQQRRLDAGHLRYPDRVLQGRFTRGACLPRIEGGPGSGRRLRHRHVDPRADHDQRSVSATTGITPGCRSNGSSPRPSVQ